MAANHSRIDNLFPKISVSERSRVMHDTIDDLFIVGQGCRIWQMPITNARLQMAGILARLPSNTGAYKPDCDDDALTYCERAYLIRGHAFILP